MEEICDRENLKEALRRVKVNKGSAGIDGMTVWGIAGYLKQHWPAPTERICMSMILLEPAYTITRF